MAAKIYFCSFFQVETRSSGRRQGQATNRPAARGLVRFPNRAVFLPLCGGARFVEKASLTSVQTFRLCFSSQILVRSSAFEASSFGRATHVHGCCCWQPCGHRALLLSPCLASAAHPKGCFLRRAGDLLRLALGSGTWVGGIEIEALDDLRFEKPTSRSL